MYKLDHITVVARSLAEGVSYVEERIGVAAPAGGRHPRMATHNCLLRLGDDLFLEIIAIDPDCAPPSRPRWFGLDKLAGRVPRLATWVLGVDDIEKSLKRSPSLVGRATEITRGDLAWMISIADDGELPLGGAFPTLIEWPPGPHPASKMQDLGCRLETLAIGHPDAAQVRSFVSGRLNDPRISIDVAQAPRLEAQIRTPDGLRRLD